MVLLNLVVIASIMAPSFRRSIGPPFSGGFGKSYFALAIVHAALVTMTEVLGLYILIAAGSNILPARLRFTRYKRWMRTALASWWLTLLLGLAAYGRWYVTPLFDR